MNVYVWGAPESLEEYSQEVGRAGRRDHQTGRAVMMVEKTIFPVRKAGTVDASPTSALEFRKNCDPHVRRFVLAGSEYPGAATCHCWELDYYYDNPPTDKGTVFIF